MRETTKDQKIPDAMTATRSGSESVTRSHSLPSSCRKKTPPRKIPRNLARGKHDLNPNYSIINTAVHNSNISHSNSTYTSSLSRSVSCTSRKNASFSRITTSASPSSPPSSVILPFLLPPSLLSRTTSTSLSAKSMASSPVLAMHIVPPPLSLSRPTSPVGTPRSEILLRETLERASSPDNTSRTNSGRPTSPPPRFTRAQTSPTHVPQGRERASSASGRNHYRVHTGTAVPRSSSPHSKQRNHQELYVTPPASYRDSADPAYVNSMAYKRLEQTLSKTTSGRRGSGVGCKRPPSAGSQTSPLARQNSREGHAFFSESRSNSVESTEILTPSSPYLYSQQQLTPPPSPPFNAQTAAKLCASIEGVVRFSDIEGLGGADMLDAIDQDDEKDKHGDEGFRKKLAAWFGWNVPSAITAA